MRYSGNGPKCVVYSYRKPSDLKASDDARVFICQCAESISISTHMATRITRTCKHTYSHTHVHALTHTRTRKHAHIRPYTRIWQRTHTCMLSHIHTHTRTHAHIHIRARGRACTYTHASNYYIRIQRCISEKTKLICLCSDILVSIWFLSFYDSLNYLFPLFGQW